MCIHTWPDHGYASADFFTCGEDVNPWKSFEYLKDFIKAAKYNCMELKRGCSKIMENAKLLQESPISAAIAVGGNHEQSTN